MTHSIQIVMSHKNKEMFIRTALASGKTRHSFLTQTGFADNILSVENTAQSFLSAVEQYAPQMVLLDLFLDDADAIGIIKVLRHRQSLPMPKCIVMNEFLSRRLERELYEAGAALTMTTPLNTESLFAILHTVESPQPFGSSTVADRALSAATIEWGELELPVTDILHQIGIPAHIKGYQYVRYAIMLSVKEPDIINAVTKQLYPCVAEKYATTPSRVERAIRHAIEVAWDRGDIEVLNAYFGYTIHNAKGKPTNSEFIAMIADKLRIHLRTAS